MICYFAKHPKDNPTQGMDHRIIAIDNIMGDFQRIYIYLSFFRNIIMKSSYINDKAVQYELNFFIHFNLVFRLIMESKLIYIHTAINGLKAIPFFFLNRNKKFICDLHGVVPEECLMNKEYIKYFFFSFSEFMCVKYAKKIIYVTKTMQEHYNNKYSSLSSKGIVLPIFEDFPVNKISEKKDLPIKVVYAGGCQKWQNVDEMINLAINSASPDIHFNFWIPKNEIVKYQALIPSNLNEYISFNNGTKIEVFEQLKLSHFGLLLRDDVKVNNVACPTKLIEYLHFGVIPIVKNKHIGDVRYYDLKLILANQLSDYKPSCFELDVAHNFSMYQEMLIDVIKSKAKLREFYESCNC